METPPIPLLFTKLPDTQRRMSASSQLFTRLDKTSTARQSRTGKLTRGMSRNSKNQSLDNSKENINYQSYLHKVKSALKIDEKQITSQYLLSLRKQYDKMAKNIKMQSTGINVMKKQIEYMRDKLKNQAQNSQTAKQKIQNKKKQLGALSVKQQQALMQTKTLEHIIQRMKQDQLKQKNDWRLKQIEVKEKQKQLKAKQYEILQWDDNIHKIYEQMEKIRKQFQKNSVERQMKFRDYRNHVIDLQQQQKFELERKERTFDLLSMESNDILDAKNIVLRDVLLTNKALVKILQYKINDLLTHYQELQNSYHLIKTQTNISDPQILVKKFFSYSESLQQITSTIGLYEKKQQQLLQRNKQLKNIQRQKITKKLVEDKIISEKSNQEKLFKQQLMQQAFQKQFEVKKIKSWIEKISINLFDNKKNQQGQNTMEKICEFLIKSVKQLKNQSVSDWKFQSPGIRLKKVVKQISIQDQKLRRSQAQQIIQTNLFQNAYLSYERKKVKKNNQFLIKTQSSKMVSK